MNKEERDFDMEEKAKEELDYNQEEKFEQEVVDYFKGKDLGKADRLLIETAQNNFKAGVEKGKAEQKQSEIEFLEKLPCDKLCNKCIINDGVVYKKIQQKLAELKQEINNG